MSDASTPTSVVLADGRQDSIIRDTFGRSITVRKLGPVERLRLFKACGQNSSNEQYLGLAAIAASVACVDGRPVPVPVNEGMIEKTLADLGDEGIEAVAGELQRRASEVGTRDEVVAAAKN